MSKIKRTFEKGYLSNFSKEIFTMTKQIPRNTVVYKLKDYEEIKGSFYDKELQKVIKGAVSHFTHILFLFFSFYFTNCL